jgi:hypothetical protein
MLQVRSATPIAFAGVVRRASSTRQEIVVGDVQRDCLKQSGTERRISIDITWDGVWAVLEVLITKQSPTKWEWRVCDRQGATIMNGFESTRRAAKCRGYRALFHLLAFGWDR